MSMSDNRLTDVLPQGATPNQVHTVCVLADDKFPLARLGAFEVALAGLAVEEDTGASAAVLVASLDTSGFGLDGQSTRELSA